MKQIRTEEDLFKGKDWNFRRIEADVTCRLWNWCAANGDAETNISLLRGQRFICFLIGMLKPTLVLLIGQRFIYFVIGM